MIAQSPPFPTSWPHSTSIPLTRFLKSMCFEARAGCPSTFPLRCTTRTQMSCPKFLTCRRAWSGSSDLVTQWPFRSNARGNCNISHSRWTEIRLNVSLRSTRRLNYGPFGYFDLRCAVGICCCAALWSGCYFGRNGSRDGSSATPLRFTASVHLVLLRGDCHYFLVCRNGAGPARSLTLLLCDELFLYPSQNRRLFFGILPDYLRDIWPLRELV